MDEIEEVDANYLTTSPLAVTVDVATLAAQGHSFQEILDLVRKLRAMLG